MNTDELMIAQLRARYRWVDDRMWVSDHGPRASQWMTIARESAGRALQHSMRVREAQELIRAGAFPAMPR